MKTFKEFDAILVGRNAKSKKFANNTYAIRLEDGSIAVKLHQTNIITFFKNGRILLTSGNWKTSTTKDRLNRFSPFCINQSKGLWHISLKPVWNEEKQEMFWPESVLFQDGMTYFRGRFKGYAKDDKKENKLRKAVQVYSKKVVESLPLPLPSGADCWYCAMREEKTGLPLGECSHNQDHILSHLKEGYLVPSLVQRAIEQAGAGPFWFQEAFNPEHKSFGDWHKKQVGKFVKRYLYKQLGLVV